MLGRGSAIDRNGTGDDHGLDRDTVVSEARRAGFELVEAYQAGWHGLLFWFFRRMVETRRFITTRTGCYGRSHRGWGELS